MTPGRLAELSFMCGLHGTNWQLVVKAWHENFSEMVIRPITSDGSYPAAEIGFFGDAEHAGPLATYIHKLLTTVHELLDEIVVLGTSESMHAEEYEKRCEALHEAIAQRDAARRERDYFFELAGEWVAAHRGRFEMHSHFEALVAAYEHVERTACDHPVRRREFPSVRRAAVEKWLLEHGGVIG